MRTVQELIRQVRIQARDGSNKLDPAEVLYRLNRRVRDFCQETKILRRTLALPVASGIVTLRPDPDNVQVWGGIFRVEDANNNFRKLQGPVTPSSLDLFPGPDWRSETQGPMKKWLWGSPPIPTKPSAGWPAGPQVAAQDGYGTILVYPAVTTGEVALHYTAEPKDLAEDGGRIDIPDYLLDGIVDGTAGEIIAESGNEALVALVELRQASYQKWIDRAKANFPTDQEG